MILIFQLTKYIEKILKKGNDVGLIISKKEVTDNLEKFGFNDENTVLLKGFENTLKDERIKKYACLELMDMYKSTYEALDLLYDKVETVVILVDDYGLQSGSCKKAVDDFRIMKKLILN